MIESFHPNKEPENEAISAAVSMLYHHLSHFQAISAGRGTYEGQQLQKARNELSKLLSAQNPGLISKAQALATILDGINPGDKSDDEVLKKIYELKDAIRTERRY